MKHDCIIAVGGVGVETCCAYSTLSIKFVFLYLE